MKRVLSNLILKIIPHPLIRGFKKKLSIHYMLFGPSLKNVGTYLLEQPHAAFSLYGMEDKLGPQVTRGFTACVQDYKDRAGLLRKYILSVDDCVIEPEYGWGITKSGRLIFDSISNNSWRECYHPSYFKYRSEKKAAVQLEEVISINIIKGGENNYWHFLHDLLGEVTMALKYIPGNFPFLISKNLSQKPFFQQALLQSPILAALKWIVRDTSYYSVKKAWFIQTMPNDVEQFYDLRSMLLIPDAGSQQNRKVFLTRSSSRIRFLKNSSQVEQVATSFGFEIVDTDGLSLQQQISLFSQTRWLVGIHGAGLTNVIYRKNAPMTVLELLPADYLQPHYFWLSKGMGHEYDCLVGTDSAIDSSFTIDPEAFNEKIRELLTT